MGASTGNRCRCTHADGHVPVQIVDALLANGLLFGPFVHIYGCSIGEQTRVGAFVEIQRGATVGARCKIGTHSFVCAGATIEDACFIGHGVYFCNDRRPRAVMADGAPIEDGDWTLEPVLVRRGVSIGTGAILLPGVTIGEQAMIGAGTIVTRDVAANTIVRNAPELVIKERPA